MCQEKKQEEDLPAFKIVSMDRYKDSKTTLKIAEEDWLQWLKQYRQHKHQENKNNQKTKIERKTTVWTLHATNKQNFSPENLDMAKKGKP